MRIYLLLLTLAFSFSVNAQFPNRSFETGGTDYADGWTWTGTGTVKRVQQSILLGDTVKAMDGQYFMEFTNSPGGTFCSRVKPQSANAGKLQWLAIYYAKGGGQSLFWEFKTYSYKNGIKDTLFKTSLGVLSNHARDTGYKPQWLQQFGAQLTGYDEREDSVEICLYFDTIKKLHPETFLLLDEVYLPFAAVSVPSITGLDFGVYPNPVKSGMPIKILGLRQEAHHYRLLDIKGRQLADGITEIKGFGQEVTLPLSLTRGIYLLQIEDDQGQLGSVKVVVQD